MNGEAIVTVSAAVVARTQLLTWAAVPDRFGPLIVLLISALGVLLWSYTQAEVLRRPELWSYFAAWIAVPTSAAGVFGFTRAASSGTRVTPPLHAAAGSETTTA